MNIVLLGAPGSGKGTQGERLRQQLDLQHVATGDLFRAHLKVPTELGRTVGEYMDRGELVPDATTVQMLREHLAADAEETCSGALFDGFPRTLEQAKALEELLAARDQCVNGVVYVRVSADEIVKRLSGRLICGKCQVPFHQTLNPFVSCSTGECDSGEYLCQREDDRPATVRRRLETYLELTAPLVDYYLEKGLLCEVDGAGTVAQVSARVLQAIDQIRLGMAG